jgi:hypothetical protein
MALRDVTRLWYCLFVLVVGLLILVTAEILMRGSVSRASSGSRAVLFLRELCLQPQVNVTRLEGLAAQYVASMDDSDPVQLDILSKSGRCLLLSSRKLVYGTEIRSVIAHCCNKAILSFHRNYYYMCFYCCRSPLLGDSFFIYNLNQQSEFTFYKLML